MLSKLREKGSVKGFKRTPQRLAILAHLEGNTSHPSAEDIFQAVSRKHPSLSFATVYNTLHTLSKAGMIRELTIDPDRKRFDPDTSRHHHCICLTCRKVVDVPANGQREPAGDLISGFTVHGSHIEFYGECANCAGTKR